MPAIEWNDSMCGGVPEIDEQHRRLTGIIDELYDAYMTGRDKEILSRIILEVNEYVKYHFTTEEDYMRRVEDDYPGYDLHLLQHKEFFSRIMDFLLSFAMGKEETIMPNLLEYLTDWWRKHINGIDKELAALLRARGMA